MVIDFKITTDIDSEAARVDLTAEDEVILRMYLDEYERLRASSPMQNDIPCSLTFDFTPETGLTLTPHIPSADDLAILLHRLRPYLLAKEPYSFQKTSALLGRRLKHPSFRLLLAHIHRLWKCDGVNSQMPIVINHDGLNTEEVLIQWLNATEYHRDAEKREAIARLRTQVPPELFDFAIVSLTLEKLQAVIACAKVSSLLVGHLRELTFPGQRFIRVTPN